MSEFIDWLETLNRKDTRVRAVLRRSLAFPPGDHASAFPYVEPFLRDTDDAWRRKTHYLVAGLWAAHWREGRSGLVMSLPSACATYQDQQKSTSTERRFITLLDSDEDQLPHRLRQMVALLKDFDLDFSKLLWDEKAKTGLLNWNHDQKRTQHAWAREFYRQLPAGTETETSQKAGE